MVALNQIVDTYRLEASAQGVDQTAAAAQKLATATDAVTVSAEKQERRTLTVAKALDSFAAANDRAFKMQQTLARGEALLARAFEQGLAGTQAYQSAVSALAEKQAMLARSAVVTVAANENIGQASQIATHHLTNLGYQLSDIASSLVSGASPFTILVQQGGQIAPILGETGVMGAVRGVGSAIGRFITPAVGIVGLLTGAVALGYTAWSRYDDEQKAVGTTLQGLGRNLGLTKTQFEDLTEAAGRASNITARTAVDLGRTYAATGQYDPGNVSRLIGVSKDAAATFGMTLDEVKTKLADAFGNYAGIEGLNRQLNFLDARTQRTIQSLFDQGRAQDAIRLAIEKLPPALARADDAQGAIARGWEKIKQAISDADLALGRFLDKGTKPLQGDDKLKALQDAFERAKQEADAANAAAAASTRRSQSYINDLKTPVGDARPRLSGGVGDFRFPDAVDTAELERKNAIVKDAQQKLLDYGKQVDATRQAEQKAAEQKALEESLNRKSNELRGITKEVGAGSDEWLRYRDLQSAVDAALKSGDPALMKAVDNVKDLSEAQDILRHVTESTTNAEGQRMTAAEKAERQRQLEIAGVRAVTTEQKASVAQMQAQERARGQLITASQAQADAEHAGQMIREEEARQLRDMLRDQAAEADGIRQRIALLDLDDATRAALIAKQKTEADLTRQGISLNSDLAQSVIKGAEANARLGVAYDQAAEAQRRMQDAARELGSDVVNFLDAWILKAGKFEDALKSALGSFASSSLNALLTGQGSLAGLFGTASTEKGQMGGLLGGQGLTRLFDTGGLKDAVGDGAFKGITDAFGPLLKPKAGADGKMGGFASTPLGQGLGVAAAGGAIGYSSGSPLMGALGGGLAGLMTGNPLLAVAGATAGLIGGIVGGSQQRKAARQQRIEAWNEYQGQVPAIDQFRATLRGDSLGNVGSQIAQAQQQLTQAGQEAAKAGDTAMVEKLNADFSTFVLRSYSTFTRGFQDMIADMGRGLGPNGPFAQASAAVIALGENLKGFVADAKNTGLGPGVEAAARQAAQAAALDALDPTPALSTTQARLREIAGTASGLSQVLADLGMSADQAAAAIRDRTAKALDALKASFDDDLTRKINAASGAGYLNDVADLMKERQSLLSDAAALGTDAGRVESYVTSAAQKIVDESELTGDAFSALTAQFPDLTGRVHEFAQALDTAAAKAAAAARTVTYGDRLFTATNDTSTLEGQLAAYDRKAGQERLAEAQAGGQAMADLEAAQSAERLKIVRDYYAQEATTRAQALAQAKSAFDTWAKGIGTYRTGLLTGSDSPLSPGDRLAAAQSAYDAQLAAAKGGDRTALDGITTSAETLRNAAQAMYASGKGYQDVFARIQGDLTALPDQVRPEQFLADAIGQASDDITAETVRLRESLLGSLRTDNPAGVAQALGTYFGALDTGLDGLLSPDEFLRGLGPLATTDEQAKALDIFKKLDANGDGMLSQLELAANTLAGIAAMGDPALLAAALVPQFGALDTSLDGLLSSAEFVAGLGPLATADQQSQALEVFRAIDANGDGLLSAIELMRQGVLTGLDANSPALVAQALSGQFDALTGATGGLLSYAQLVTAISPLATTAEQQAARTIFGLIDANGDGLIDRMELLRAKAGDIVDASTGTTGAVDKVTTAVNDNVTATQAVQAFTGIYQNSFGYLLGLTERVVNNLVSANGHAGAKQYAVGGWVNGPGTGTSDSIAARLSNGEFVVNAAAARLNAPLLDAMNGTPGMVPMMAVQTPMPMMPANDTDLGAEVRALRAEVSRLTAMVKASGEMNGRVTKQAGEQVARAVSGTTDAVEQGNDDRRKGQQRTTMAGRAPQAAA